MPHLVRCTGYREKREEALNAHLIHSADVTHPSGGQTGKYDNIRLMAGNSQSSTSFPWRTARQSIAGGNASNPSYSLFQFSAACWYFAEVLTNTLRAANQPVPAIGLISTAIGGSMIEEWLLNDTIASCKNLSLATHNQMLYDQKVRPYLSMTLKGWLWYQVRLDIMLQ